MVRGKFVFAAALVASVAGFLAAQITTAQTPNAGGAAELKLLRTIPLGGTGNWDYPTVDSEGKRLYIARAARVMVVDLETGKLVGEVADVNGAHGVATIPERNQGFASAGKDNAVVVFDLKTFKVLQKVKAGKNPDAIIYDPASKKVFAMCHTSGEVTAIDPANLDKEPVNLKVGSALEYAVADGKGHIYVNDEKTNETIAIDSMAMKVLGKWSLTPGTGPTGLAMDIDHHRLFSTCAGNQKMVILDSETGKVVTTVPIGNGVDGAAFDSKLGVALSSNNREGTVSVIAQKDGNYGVVQTVKTATGAKTITVNPRTHEFYLPANVPAPSGTGTTFGVVVVGVSDEKK